MGCWVVRSSGRWGSVPNDLTTQSPNDPPLLNSGSSFDCLSGVTAEGARKGEFSQLMANHVLGHEDRDMLSTIVHHECVADEQREDSAAARPGLDGPLFAPRGHIFDLFHQPRVRIRP